MWVYDAIIKLHFCFHSINQQKKINLHITAISKKAVKETIDSTNKRKYP